MNQVRRILLLVFPSLFLLSSVSFAQGSFPSIDYFRSNPTQIEGNQPVRLFWSVRNAVRVDIYDGFRGTTISDLGLENSVEVWPTKTSVYTLYAYGENGQIVQQALPVLFKTLFIDFFTASIQLTNPGQPVRLAWSVQGASRVDVFDGNLNTNYSDLTRPNGFIEVYPTITSTYTLTVYNLQGEARVSQVSVVVRNSP